MSFQFAKLRVLASIRFSAAILFSVWLFASETFATNLAAPLAPPSSARRAPDESFEAAARRSLPDHLLLPSQNARQIKSQEELSAYEARSYLANLNTSLVPHWLRQADVFRGFYAVRDVRFLYTDTQPTFARRETWLYPDDGCYARASLMGRNLQAWGYARPAKVFSFGKLTATTPNTLDGSVSWWYHVAPIVQAEGQFYVLDPSINPQQPMLLIEWLRAQVTDLNEVQVSICDAYTYTPSSYCYAANPDSDQRAVNDQRIYLDYEWQRQIQLHRDPMLVLGEHPPWMP